MIDEEEYAIVILNYNSANMVIHSVNSLKKLNKNIQIVVVDNCSTDNSKEILDKNLNNLINVWTIYSDKNNGYASGNNIGLKFVKETLKKVKNVFIMNPDIEILSTNTISNLINVLNADKSLGAITAQTIYNETIKFPNDFGWKMYNKKELMLSGTILGKILKINTRYDKIALNQNNVAYIDIIQGCFFGIKMEAIEKINLLDEGTFLYGEEVILAKKMKKNGYKLGVLATEFIKHNHREKKKALIRRNNKIFDMKCFYGSRKYIIDNYVESNKIYKYISKLFLNIDYFIKKIYISLIYKY